MKIDLLDRARLEVINKKNLRYHLQDAEKDYFLAVIMSLISDSVVGKKLVFKGGTAIYHCYIEQLRFSRDLDFTAMKPLLPDELESVFSGHDILSVKNMKQKKYGINCFIQYRGVLSQPDTIEVNINTNQKVLLKPEIVEYNNCYGISVSCNAMDIEEIFAEKLRTVIERARPRDAYDVVILQKKFGLSIKEGMKLLEKKELKLPLDKKSIEENIRISLERFETDMRELYYREPVEKQEVTKLMDEITEETI